MPASARATSRSLVNERSFITLCVDSYVRRIHVSGHRYFFRFVARRCCCAFGISLRLVPNSRANITIRLLLRRLMPPFAGAVRYASMAMMLLRRPYAGRGIADAMTHLPPMIDEAPLEEIRRAAASTFMLYFMQDISISLIDEASFSRLPERDDCHAAAPATMRGRISHASSAARAS